MATQPADGFGLYGYPAGTTKRVGGHLTLKENPDVEVP
jgi:hypothetical protein